MNIKNSKYPGIYESNNKYMTKSLTLGKFFQEKTLKDKSGEYRLFDPRQSKLASAIFQGIKQTGIKEDSLILYLGAAHGVTASYLSDIVTKGFIFALEISFPIVRELIKICQKRKNIAPILADANHPKSYKDKLTQVDVIYQDVAQKNQLQILVKNSNLFLKEKGHVLFAVKARSIDVTKNPKEIYKELEEKLKENFNVLDKIILDPYQKDHCMFLLQKV